MAFGQFHTPFHKGELEIQKLANVQDEASELSDMINDSLPPNINNLLLLRNMIFISSVSPDGTVWSSALFGQPGFVKALSTRTIEISSLPTKWDPLFHNLKVSNRVGLLAIDLKTRNRYRINGFIQQVGKSSFLVRVTESYPNCPKYIQKRIIQEKGSQESQIINSRSLQQLEESHRKWITESDTFFLGSSNPQGDMDISHRGGLKGFVRVKSENEIEWPDYPGNNMFNSLGNIAINPKAGILFLNFESGDALQLTGEVTIHWDNELEGTERVLKMKVKTVNELKNYCPFRFSFLEFSHYNPALQRQQTSGTLVKCISIKQETPNVKTFTFASSIVYHAGQYATFQLEIGGKLYERTWTISSSPHEKDFFSITVKKKGLVSHWLHEWFQVGHSIQLIGVGGDFSCFLLPEIPKKMVMIAGGIGITPLLSMIRTLFHSSSAVKSNVKLLFSLSTIQDIAFKEELLQLQTFGLDVVFILSQETHCNWDNCMNGRMNSETIKKAVPDLKERQVFLCGPEGFMQSTLKSLDELQFPMQKVHLERFAF